MDPQKKLSALLKLAEDTGIVVRRVRLTGESSEHPGGSLVRLRDQQMLLLDPSASIADRIQAAAEALRGRPELQDSFIPPEIRELIEREDTR